MKSLFVVLVSAALAFAPAAGAAQSVTVVVNGQTMSFSQPPIVRTGRVFVPLRSVFERLGASVVYSNGQINATGRRRTISLTIGSTQATVDGQAQVLDVAPFVVGATTFVPLRFISQALGAAVNWNDATDTVTIDAAGAPAPRPPAPAPRPPAAGISLSYRSPTGTIRNRRPEIRFQLSRPLKVGSFRVFVDGRNATPALVQNGQTFTLVAPWPLAAGNHRVRVFGTTARGVAFDLSWSFVQGR